MTKHIIEHNVTHIADDRETPTFVDPTAEGLKICSTKWLKETMAKSQVDDVHEQGDRRYRHRLQITPHYLKHHYTCLLVLFHVTYACIYHSQIFCSLKKFVSLPRTPEIFGGVKSIFANAVKVNIITPRACAGIK